MNDLITQQPGPVLSYLDHEKELQLQMHAFKSGLDAVMPQFSKLFDTYPSIQENSADREGAVCYIV